MPTADIVINRPREFVWKFFTTPSQWEAWWGGDLTCVDPGWQDGAKIVWKSGAPSLIASYEENHILRIDDAWLATTFRFEPSGRSSTLLEVEFAPRGGAQFSDGGSAYQSKTANCIAKLKQLIEAQAYGDGWQNLDRQIEKPKMEMSEGPGGRPLGIEFKQEAFNLLKRMDQLSADHQPGKYAIGERVRIRMPLAGTAKPTETGLKEEIILDEGLEGIITAVLDGGMVRVRWNEGKYRIYRDIDLSSMNFVDCGSLQLQPFESPVHSSYLEKQNVETTMLELNPTQEMDFKALRGYWSNLAQAWWKSQREDNCRCDSCNGKITCPDGYLIGAWIRCESCLDRNILTDSNYQLFLANPDYAGDNFLQKARQFCSCQESTIRHGHSPSPEHKPFQYPQHVKLIVEADTVEAARESICSQMPRGHTILLEKVVADRNEHSLKVHGRDSAECYAIAKGAMPDNVSIISEFTFKHYRKFKKHVRASSLDEAKQLLLNGEQYVTIESVYVRDKGKSKLFGLVKSPDVYEGELEQDEAIEFVFRHRQAKLYARTGSSICPPKSLFQFDDLPEWLWGCTQLGWDTQAGVQLRLRGYAPVYEFDIYRKMGSDAQDIISRFSHIAEELFLCGLMHFTVKSLDNSITFTEYEPVCYSLIDFYKSTLVTEIGRIKNGNMPNVSIRVSKAIGVDVNHMQDNLKADILVEGITHSFRCFEEFLATKSFNFRFS